MRRFVILFVSVLSLMYVSNVNAFFLERGSYFIGLWQGIDPIDGSEVLLSISKNDDGTFSTIGHESNFFVCNDTDKGVSTGTGHIESGVLVTSEIVQCFSANETIGPYPVEYTPDKKKQILNVKYPDDPSDAGSIILYRISK